MSEPHDTNTMRSIDVGMSNCDHQIDEGAAEALQSDPGRVRGEHTAWNFWGAIYYADGQFHEEVWVHHSPRETVSAATLKELMRAVNDRYGWD